MKNYEAGRIRNVGLIAHGGAGKTSLVEAMLFNTGVTTRIGRVEDGTTVGDYHPEEIKRGMTIHTSIIPVELDGIKLNILDTPGFLDFIGDVKAALRVVDGALVVVSAVDGVEVMTEITWDIAAERGLPRMVFINKLDRENANFFKVLDELKEKFEAGFVPFQIPIGSAETFEGVVDVVGGKAFKYTNGKREEIPVPENLQPVAEEYREQLIEAAAEANDDYLTKYLEGEALTPEEVNLGLAEAFRAGKLVPVFTGSAVKNIGVDLITAAAARYFGPPAVEAGKQLAALVFKTLTDPYVGRMNFVRVYSGDLKSDSTVYNANKGKTEKIGQVLYVRGKNQQGAEAAPAGDICVLVKLQETGTGDTLTTKDNPVILDGIDFPAPTLSLAISPKSKGDEDKLSTALARIVEEEPTVQIKKSTETKQTVITGMGEAQLDIIVDRFKRKYGLDVVLEPLRIPYRETIRTETKVEGKYKKQTGGRGQYGHVWIRLEPLTDGSDFVFDEEVFGGSVPAGFFPAVEKGIREAMQEGVVAGYPTTGIKAVLYDGSYHPVDSSEMAFKIAASMAFKKGVLQAQPVLLEPIMEVEVTAPEGFMGDIISDLNGKRGRILGMEPEGKRTRIRAHVPLGELARYAIDLKAMTQGRASFTMQFSSYEEMPAHLAEKVIKQAQEAAENK
ncbi:elongation factor G [Candidatus Desulforudis audaxviator]|uniref:Elongation factor G n=1 Tax=Desulforudis audaxviator (strain MP104C) TaxID=477974 RepID=B1I3X3_DESAP|nr:elongation factor G [Candidatus Desulforudis audaxviator]ACA59740.1 translation elongation factor G [Candidatus Desulforudis audaxviator MP104C]AZK59735.1 Translation elongation factor G-related protein [Candidatus Desulforudis audaxviator]